MFSRWSFLALYNQRKESGKDHGETQELYTILSNIALDLIEERNVLGWTIEDLSRASGVPASTIRSIEGLFRIPTIRTLHKLARALQKKLFITFHGDYVAVIPRRYWKDIDALAESWKTTKREATKRLLQKFLQDLWMH